MFWIVELKNKTTEEITTMRLKGYSEQEAYSKARGHLAAAGENPSDFVKISIVQENLQKTGTN